MLHAYIRGEVTNTNIIVFELIGPGLEPTIYQTQGKHANRWRLCTQINITMMCTQTEDQSSKVMYIEKSPILQCNLCTEINCRIHAVYTCNTNQYVCIVHLHVYTRMWIGFWMCPLFFPFINLDSLGIILHVNLVKDRLQLGVNQNKAYRPFWNEILAWNS
jgi:hypothetical protein